MNNNTTNNYRQHDIIVKQIVVIKENIIGIIVIFLWLILYARSYIINLQVSVWVNLVSHEDTGMRPADLQNITEIIKIITQIFQGYLPEGDKYKS